MPETSKPITPTADYASAAADKIVPDAAASQRLEAFQTPVDGLTALRVTDPLLQASNRALATQNIQWSGGVDSETNHVFTFSVIYKGADGAVHTANTRTINGETEVSVDGMKRNKDGSFTAVDGQDASPITPAQYSEGTSRLNATLSTAITMDPDVTASPVFQADLKAMAQNVWQETPLAQMKFTARDNGLN